jgi:hypothetical protein
MDMPTTRLFSILLLCILFPPLYGHNRQAGEPVKAYDIDFNWGEGGAHGFARPGLWTDAVLARCFNNLPLDYVKR